MKNALKNWLKTKTSYYLTVAVITIATILLMKFVPRIPFGKGVTNFDVLFALIANYFLLAVFRFAQQPPKASRVYFHALAILLIGILCRDASGLIAIIAIYSFVTELTSVSVTNPSKSLQAMQSLTRIAVIFVATLAFVMIPTIVHYWDHAPVLGELTIPQTVMVGICLLLMFVMIFFSLVKKMVEEIMNLPGKWKDFRRFLELNEEIFAETVSTDTIMTWYKYQQVFTENGMVIPPEVIAKIDISEFVVVSYEAKKIELKPYFSLSLDFLSYLVDTLDDKYLPKVKILVLNLINLPGDYIGKKDLIERIKAKSAIRRLLERMEYDDLAEKVFQKPTIFELVAWYRYRKSQGIIGGDIPHMQISQTPITDLITISDELEQITWDGESLKTALEMLEMVASEYNDEDLRIVKESQIPEIMKIHTLPYQAVGDFWSLVIKNRTLQKLIRLKTVDKTTK